ncbi:glycosyl transferase family 2 [Idiomarina aquatica]|uniref:Glycosyl transferase family 2 n=1 Tax=Idiomarina aquatica TaxID=1327752 RepID=A0A4R6PPV7_9GAMM|nr:glycosyltransferase family 2 protein [Idiomarina aquatica]TDP40223.1 glycosyl transferase family 2 [Idiomarina aquatica]
MSLPSVTVLLASYNGGAYIQEQLASVLASEGVTVNVVVRDDGSTDDTVVKAQSFGSRVTVIQRTELEPDYGHLANFSALCEHAKAHTNSDYYAFCDQDDIWFADKLVTLVDAIREIEDAGQTPALVHCDLQVVDADLQPLSESYWRYQGLPDPGQHRLDKLMYQNVVTGCACLFNRALLNAATPVPNQAVVHDYWFALVAEAIGKVTFIDKPLLAYRQHGANSIGSVSFDDQRSYFKKFLYQMLWRFPGNLAASQRQAKALLERFELEPSKCELLSRFAAFAQLGVFRRVQEGHRLLQTRQKSLGERLYLTVVFLMLPREHKKGHKK